MVGYSFDLGKILKVLKYILIILPDSVLSESELFTGDMSKDNHSPGPVFREVSP